LRRRSEFWRVDGSGFGVPGSGFRFGFQVRGSGSGSRFGVQVRGFPRFGVSGVQGSGVRGSRFFAEVQRPWRGSCRVEWVTTSASGPCGCTSERRAMINDGQGPGPDGGNGDTDGDPVDLSTGQFVMDKTDLVVRDVIPVTLTRTYRTGDNGSRPFGIGGQPSVRGLLWSAHQYSCVKPVRDLCRAPSSHWSRSRESGFRS
jgi:hypothetical protein